MNLLIIGQMRSPSGYSNALRGYVKALDRYIGDSNHTLYLYDFTLDNNKYISDEYEELYKKYEIVGIDNLLQFCKNNEYFLIFHYPVHCYEQLVHMCADFKQVYDNAYINMCMTLWEANHVPKHWISTAEKYKIDIFAAACLWNKEIFTSDFNKECLYIPCVAYSNVYSDKRIDTIDSKKFNILSISQFGYRKGFDILIKAYIMEFKNQEDVNLIIKTYGSKLGEEHNENIIAEISSFRNRISVTDSFGKPTRPIASINVITDKLSDKEMSMLYNSVDVYALFSRGEGFGLPYAEAMSHGKPIICPDNGGHLDFADIASDQKYSYFAKSTLTTCFDGSYNTPLYGVMFYDSDMKWYETDVDSAREQLRFAYNDWKAGSLIKKGELAKSIIQNFNIDYIGKQFIKEIDRALTILKK